MGSVILDRSLLSGDVGYIECEACNGRLDDDWPVTICGCGAVICGLGGCLRVHGVGRRDFWSKRHADWIDGKQAPVEDDDNGKLLRSNLGGNTRLVGLYLAPNKRGS